MRPFYLLGSREKKNHMHVIYIYIKLIIAERSILGWIWIERVINYYYYILMQRCEIPHIQREEACDSGEWCDLCSAAKFNFSAKFLSSFNLWGSLWTKYKQIMIKGKERLCQFLWRDNMAGEERVWDSREYVLCLLMFKNTERAERSWSEACVCGVWRGVKLL